VKNKRPLPIRKRCIEENALLKGDNLIKTSLICLTRPTLCKLFFNSLYTIHTIQYSYYSLDTVLNTEIQYCTKQATYARISIKYVVLPYWS